MQRRTLFKASIAGGLVLAATAVGIQLSGVRLPWSDDKLDPRGRAIFAAIAKAVLEGTLSPVPSLQAAEVSAHLTRVESAIAQFPPHLQTEVGQLLALLATPPGRRWFASLEPAWEDASPAAVQQALQSLRTARLDVRRQAYHALRDLTNAAYYSEPGTWAHLGYPGPIPV